MCFTVLAVDCVSNNYEIGKTALTLRRQWDVFFYEN